MNKPVTYIHLGSQGAARVYPEGSLSDQPELDIFWHPNTGQPSRVNLIGRERVLELAHGILAAMGVSAEAPAPQVPDLRAKVIVELQERIASLEGALDLAGSQMEEAQAEVTRMRAAAEKPKRAPRKAAEEAPPVVLIPEAELTDNPAALPEETHLTAAGLAETQAIIDTMDQGSMPGITAELAPNPIPERWRTLPEPKLLEGERVTLLMKREDGSWGTPQATLVRVYPGSSQQLVQIEGRAPFTIDEDRIKASPFTDLADDAEFADPAAPPPTFITSPAGDPERFLTVEERKAFIALTVKMGLKPEKVQALMDEHLGFADTGRLTPEKRDALMPHLENAAKVLF